MDTGRKSIFMCILKLVWRKKRYLDLPILLLPLLFYTLFIFHKAAILLLRREERLTKWIKRNLVQNERTCIFYYCFHFNDQWPCAPATKKTKAITSTSITTSFQFLTIIHIWKFSKLKYETRGLHHQKNTKIKFQEYKFIYYYTQYVIKQISNQIATSALLHASWGTAACFFCLWISKFGFYLMYRVSVARLSLAIFVTLLVSHPLSQPHNLFYQENMMCRSSTLKKYKSYHNIT